MYIQYGYDMNMELAFLFQNFCYSYFMFIQVEFGSLRFTKAAFWALAKATKGLSSYFSNTSKQIISLFPTYQELQQL